VGHSPGETGMSVQSGPVTLREFEQWMRSLRASIDSMATEVSKHSGRIVESEKATIMLDARVSSLEERYESFASRHDGVDAPVRRRDVYVVTFTAGVIGAVVRWWPVLSAAGDASR
jgi:hypothetical protein